MVDPRTSLVSQTSAALEPTRGVLDLARGATTGDVGARRHAASRERLLDRLGRPTPVARPRTGHSSRVYVLVAAAATLALLGTGGAVAVRARSQPPAVHPVSFGAPLEYSLDKGAPHVSQNIEVFQRRAGDCWRHRPAEPPTMRGTVTLALTVDDAGHVASAALADHEDLSDEVARCVVRTAAELSFESGPATAFRFRVRFSGE